MLTQTEKSTFQRFNDWRSMNQRNYAEWYLDGPG
jgi:hypothetical protein